MRYSGQAQGDLHPVFAMQLADNRAHEVLDALLFESHRLRDLLVRVSLCDEARDLVFAAGELEAMGRHPWTSASPNSGPGQIGAQRLRLVEQCLGRIIARNARFKSRGQACFAVGYEDRAKFSERLCSEKELDVIV